MSTYNKTPFFPIAGKAYKGWNAIIDELNSKIKSSDSKRSILVIECYQGVNHDELINGFNGLDYNVFINSDEAFHSDEEIRKLTYPDVTDDAIFGFITRLNYSDFLNFEKVKKLREKINRSTGLVVVYSHAASLIDTARNNSLITWNKSLGRITVEGKNDTDKVKFYTGLYHALLGRGLASDVNGAYPMNNGKVGQIPQNADGTSKYNCYNTDAIWGGFWNLTQLWALAYPEYYADWIQGQLLVYKDAGWLGDGIANSKYVSGVGTNFTGLAIASAYNCGIQNFDVALAYEAALKNEITWKDRIEGAGKMDLKQFVEHGYSAHIDNIGFNTVTEGSGFSASHTLEYSYSSFAVAQFAKSLGKIKDYEQLMKLSKGWKLLYNPQAKFICPKDASGKFIDKFDPSQPWRGFQEGNAWQYTFYVPHDIEELVQALGKQTFNDRLETIFEASQKNVFGGGTKIDAFAGLLGLYNHGNQPNLHISWLFNFSGKPYLTQKWVHAICDEFYGTEGIHGYGYGQDEDQGQLGAWYVMSSIGLFDVKGLTEINPSFQISSPLFDKVTIKLPKSLNRKDFIIEVANNSKENVYLQKAVFNNHDLKDLKIDFKDVTKGGIIKMAVDSKPSQKWSN